MVRTILSSLLIVAIPILVTRLLLNVKKIGEGQGTKTRTGEIVSTLIFKPPQRSAVEDNESEPMANQSGTDSVLDSVRMKTIQAEDEEKHRTSV